MTLLSPPNYLQAGSYPAQYDRLNAQALFGTTGILGASSLVVTANSPAGMSVLVAAGWCSIIGTTTTDMGVYTTYNDASQVLTITAADPTNPRIDRVVITVRDAYYTGAFNDVIFQVVAGTPASSPTAPAIPANSISLATIAVGAAVTQINSGNITDTRVQTTTNVSAQLNISVNAQTGTTYGVLSSDAQKVVTLSNAGAITVTIPTNSSQPLPVGTQITFIQINTGQVTVQGAGGVSILSNGATTNQPKTRVAYSAITCVQTVANTWIAIGDIV